MTQHINTSRFIQVEIDNLIDEFQEDATQWECLPDSDEKCRIARELTARFDAIKDVMTTAYGTQFDDSENL